MGGGGGRGRGKEAGGAGLATESCVRLSEGGLRRVKGEFGAAEDGLLARRRRQRRLIHPGGCDGSSHGRGCGDHRPEGVQCGNWLARNGGHGRDCRHAWHTREGAHCTGCWVGILELRVLLQLLVVLCIVPKRGGNRGGYTGTRERITWRKERTDGRTAGRTDGRTCTVAAGRRGVIEGSAGTGFSRVTTGAFPRVPTRLSSATYRVASTATWCQRSAGGLPPARWDQRPGRAC